MIYPVDSKPCICCGNIILRTNRQCNSVWLAIRFCNRNCATHWRHHKKPFSEMPVLEPRYCLYCEKLLVRRKDEQSTAWHKRQYCNKSHAAHVKGGQKVIIKDPISADQRIHLTRYIPDTPEFNQLASMYLERGF